MCNRPDIIYRWIGLIFLFLYIYCYCCCCCLLKVLHNLFPYYCVVRIYTYLILLHHTPWHMSLGKSCFRDEKKEQKTHLYGAMSCWFSGTEWCTHTHTPNEFHFSCRNFILLTFISLYSCLGFMLEKEKCYEYVLWILLCRS